MRRFLAVTLGQPASLIDAAALAESALPPHAIDSLGANPRKA
jgi:hypothetical protein